MSSITDFEINYDSDVQHTSATAYEDALKARRAEKEKEAKKIDNPALVTSNTGPVGHEVPRPDSINAYLTFLEMEYPDSIFSIGEFSGDIAELTGIGGMMLSEGLLHRMIDDPLFAAEMESSIQGLQQAEKSYLEAAHQAGTEVFSYGVIINSNGDARTWNFTLDAINASIQTESTRAFMDMEELREKAMKIETEHHIL